MTALSENLAQLEDRISAACRAANRPRGEVELMAVSKTFPAEAILEAAALGITLFGENRVQEFAAKAPVIDSIRSSTRSCLIGHLQSNKAARAVELFDGIDSLDSLRLAERINEMVGREMVGRQAAEEEAACKLGKRLPILLEIKLSREETKAGLDPESSEAAQLLEALPDFSHLDAQGLMTIAPWGAPDDVTRACFRSLCTLRDRWATSYPRLNLPVLSMGMSGDFELAIAEGATRIRVGTALFGRRLPAALKAAADMDRP